MTKNKRFSMDKSGDLYDKNKMIMLDFGYSYDGVGCKRIIELLNSLSEENEQLKNKIKSLRIELSTHKHPLWSIREAERVVNELKKENEQLKKEKENWKSSACNNSSFNSILINELSIAQEQGYEPSKYYKEYIASIKSEYDKFWGNKIKTHNNRLKRG